MGRLDDGITLLQARVRGYLQRAGKLTSLGGPPSSPPPPSGVAALAGLRHKETELQTKEGLGSSSSTKPKPLSGLAKHMSKHSMKGVPNNSPKRGTITAKDVHEERHF